MIFFQAELPGALDNTKKVEYNADPNTIEPDKLYRQNKNFFTFGKERHSVAEVILFWLDKKTMRLLKTTGTHWTKIVKWRENDAIFPRDETWLKIQNKFLVKNLVNSDVRKTTTMKITTELTRLDPYDKWHEKIPIIEKLAKDVKMRKHCKHWKLDKRRQIETDFLF